MKRTQIIASLITCLKGISREAGYKTTPALVLRGIHLAEDLNAMPALTLFNERVESEDLAAARSERGLVMHLWGAVKAPHGDYSQLDDLAEDVIRALSDEELNPLWPRISAQKLEMYEGGAGDPLGLFDLEFVVTYEAGLGAL